MQQLYQEDLAYIQAEGFGRLAQGAAPEIIRLLKTAAVPIRRVVDAGCGAGALAKLLVDGGFDVVGIDSSPELLAIARVAAPGARFVHTSIYEVAFPACDAVIALGEPLSYHGEKADADDLIYRFFRNAAAALPVGGQLIFDVIEAGEPSLAGRSWSSGEDWAVLVDTTEDRAGRRLVRTIETFRRDGDSYRRGQEVHCVRLFDTEALSEQLASCGFAVRTATSYGRQPLPPRRRAFFATLVRRMRRRAGGKT